MKQHAITRRIWITGATSGIGEALAKHIADLGHLVIATGRNPESLEALNQHSNIEAIALDVCDDAAMERFKATILAEHGSIDCVVVNAGTCEYVDALPPDDAKWQRVYDANLKGAMATINCALPLLAASPHRGQVVGMLSQVVFAPFSQSEFYGATKAALDYYLQSLRIDLFHHEIDVTAIYPGFVKTPLTDRNHFDMPFIVSAEEAAQKITKAIMLRKNELIFPKRLYYSLKMIRWMPFLWRPKLANRPPISIR